MDVLTSIEKFWFSVRTLFYAITPSESLHEKLADVPKYVQMATIPFFLLIIVEQMLLRMRGRRMPRLSDVCTSVACGIVSQLPWILLRNIEVSVYDHIYEKYSIYRLPLSSTTWWFCMIGVDLGYYWVHRCAHEINFMWAGHQTHHSSEDYNLSTALRQGVFQKLSSWVFYLPLAFFVAPPIFLVHLQLNLLYQFWIHTEVVDKLGPLEWVLNTPSHHRVHHGINRYCIDKNYAGVLIVWDRLFGTFAAEDEKDPVVYGLTHQIESWDPLYAQISHWSYIVKSLFNFESIKGKLEILLKGPGWGPGKPRLGLITDIPDVHAPNKRFMSETGQLTNYYCAVHFLIAILFYDKLVHNGQEISTTLFLIAALVIFWTFTNIGHLFENRNSAMSRELLRCLFCILIMAYMTRSTFTPISVALQGALLLHVTSVVAILAYLLSNGFAPMKQE